MLYSVVKHLHMAAAGITAALFILRLGLDAAGRPWRHTPLRWLPHANDTVLLASAVTLLALTGWHPLTEYWLIAKLVLLAGYILTAKQALDAARTPRARAAFAGLALTLLSLILFHALTRPG